MKEKIIDPKATVSPLEHHRSQEDEFVDKSNFARKSEFVQDEFFNEKEPVREFKIIKPEQGLCRKCKEWTELEDSCCGKEYVHVD